jgi:hypothetical protein
MRLEYDTHGDKHFGGGNGTIWQNSKDNVLRAAENYLRNKEADCRTVFLILWKKIQPRAIHKFFYIFRP